MFLFPYHVSFYFDAVAIPKKLSSESFRENIFCCFLFVHARYIKFGGYMEYNMEEKAYLVYTLWLNVNKNFINIRPVVDHTATHLPSIMRHKSFLFRFQLETAHTPESRADQLAFSELPDLARVKADHVARIRADAGMAGAGEGKFIGVFAANDNPRTVKAGLPKGAAHAGSNNGTFC